MTTTDCDGHSHWSPWGGAVRINDPDCVRNTFPQYFGALASFRSAGVLNMPVPVIAIDGPSCLPKGNGRA